jgi:hypothetical protein
MSALHPSYAITGESLELSAVVVPVISAEGLVPKHGAAGLGRLIGNKIGRHKAVEGPDGSLARTLPTTRGGRMLQLTSHRIMLVDPKTKVPEWQAPRTAVAGIKTSPRLQLMAKFRVVFADGSSFALLTMSGKTVRTLADRLGTAH